MSNLKIVYAWNGMKCKICFRYQQTGVCDLNGPQDENNYCPLFIPKPTFNRQKIISFWEMHTQRWIREGQVCK